MGLILNGGQDELRKEIKQWFYDWENGRRIRNHPQWYAYSGAAGTGKTTVIKEAINELGLSDEEFICCAYVGKAVLQLQRHDLPASTIHSLIYNTVLTKVPIVDGDLDDPPFKVVFQFILKEALSSALRLIIVDEATMVNDSMRDSILSFGLPVVFIGDMNQLPPIFGMSSVMMSPDYILTQIMRQSEDDPIVILSQMVLKGIPYDIGQYGKSSVVSSYEINRGLIEYYDIILCGKNKTRDGLNDVILDEILHRKNKTPFIGAKVVNRQNNWDVAVDNICLTNGLIGYITSISKSCAYKGYYKIDFRPDFMESEFEGLKVDAKYILLDYEGRKSFGITRNEKFEYAYAITTHIAQGSEFENVLFIDESFWDAEMTKKLRYTAITRARNSITIVKNTSGYHGDNSGYKNFVRRQIQ